jgi:hypothetical protein
VSVFFGAVTPVKLYLFTLSDSRGNGNSLIKNIKKNKYAGGVERYNRL